MKRKSILALNLTAILLVSISLFGCGNISRTRTNNDVTRQNDITNDGIRSGSVDGTGTGANNAQNGTDGNMQGGTSGNMQGAAGNGTVGGNTNQNNAVGDTNQNNVAGSTSDTTRDRTGLTTNDTTYRAADFKNDFTNAGYDVKESTNTNKNDYFKGNETDYLLGGDVVRIYEYNSPTELEWAINRIVPNGMNASSNNANSNTSPYYYRKGNTLIVYEGKEPAYVDEFGKMYGNTLRPQH
ncbi:MULTISPECIES: hypothetical protein [Clostridium]|jgi:hypothetical protein|uniref:Lipoprotein n=2 Tax=Clostridium beijerinckii TaxID=1520 RepID=A0AAE2V3D8_CLOBE|nr:MULTISPECIES: hypothetical protein [Clostridium]ABR34714.1 hypothetical protein Cbei_2558 [Clostridium beijerinckii NCIMB 8052]AIU01448.1 hypothetical protein Cbs_2558 [Clostridium beijerinckii ATCC 35702]ALB46191.1 hypothetical protein X276_13560 [Clostridium beijerinckii NRRL B-598]MBF7810656.1 hypothetical protein [Clostridium beijerinckii]NOW91378.1 hypothetical protein [Clostridium beijerinckii]